MYTCRLVHRITNDLSIIKFNSSIRLNRESSPSSRPFLSLALHHKSWPPPFPSFLIPTPHRRLRIPHRRRRRRIPHLRRRRPIPKRWRAYTIPRRHSSRGSIPAVVRRLVVALPRRPRVVASRMAVSSLMMVAVVPGVGRRRVVVAAAVMPVTAVRVARVGA
jgi:hypothetical protein